MERLWVYSLGKRRGTHQYQENLLCQKLLLFQQLNLLLLEQLSLNEMFQLPSGVLDNAAFSCHFESPVKYLNF